MTPKQISSLRPYEPWLALALKAHPAEVYHLLRTLGTFWEHRHGTLWDHPNLRLPCGMCGERVRWFHDERLIPGGGCFTCHIRWLYRKMEWSGGPEPAHTQCCEICGGHGHPHGWGLWTPTAVCVRCHGKGMVRVGG